MRNRSIVLKPGQSSSVTSPELLMAFKVLREDAERLDLVLKGSNDAFWDWNVATDEIYLSPRWYEMLGFDEGETTFHRKELTELLHPEDRPWVLSELDRLFNEPFDTPCEMEHRMRTASGGYIWVLFRGLVNARDREGKALRMAGTCTDITARKRAEEELRRSEDRFAKSFMASPDGIVITRLRSGTVVDCNDAFLAIMGCSRDEVIGQAIDHIQTWVNEEDRRTFLDAIRRKEECSNIDTSFRRADGEIIPSLVSGRIVEIEAEPCILSILRDMREQLKAAHAVRESEQLYRSLIETSPDAIGLLDLEARVVMINQQAAVMHGVESIEKAVGTDALEFIIPHERERALADVMRIRAGESIRNAAYTLSRRDGTTFQAEISASLVRDGAGEPKGLLVILRDVTERQRLQRQFAQAQRMESIGTLAGGIAHDFNNLLAVILGNASVHLRDPSLPEKMHDSLSDIVDAAERGSALTRQMLAYARSGLQQPTRMDLNERVESVLPMLRRASPVRIDFAPQSATCPIFADPTQIEQVIMNLCLNAIQASRPSAVIELETRIEILDELRAAPLELRFGRYACLTVKDSGCGMDSATLDRIFEPFFTTKPTGRGMGLAASLGIVRSHQGQIVAKSKPGQGTMMSVLLPAVANDTTPTAAPEEATAQTIGKPLPTGYETILVVDSDPVTRHASEQILARQGYCVVTHDSLEHGLAFLDTNAEDIDLVVYGSDTADQAAAKAVSDISERAQHKPIVLMGYPDDAEKIRTSLGGSRPLFEPKPPTPRTLALTVRRAIDDVQSEA